MLGSVLCRTLASTQARVRYMFAFMVKLFLTADTESAKHARSLRETERHLVRKNHRGAPTSVCGRPQATKGWPKQRDEIKNRKAVV